MSGEPGVRLPAGRLAAYSAFAAPLAMAALPLYVQLPRFYGELGLSLTLVGVILLAARALDALQDPLLGLWCDRWDAGRSESDRRGPGGRRAFIAMSVPLLGLGLWGLFHPPQGEAQRIALFVLLLVIVHLGFSMGSIGYQAWGAQLSRDTDERTRVTACREAVTLAGVILASVLPAALGGSMQEQMARFAWVYLGVLVACALVTLAFSPAPARVSPEARPFRWHDLWVPVRQRAFRRLLAVFVLSGIAASIPSTLVLFFVADVLRAESWTPAFLGAYFLAGALSMPLWVALARRRGKPVAWTLSMLLAVTAFVLAFALGPGDEAAFLAICIASGAALGADLALPPSMLADVIDEEYDGAGREGAYFGLWNLAGKANLAFAAGIALPLVSLLGYVPGSAGNGGTALAAVYCLVPCAFKLAAAVLLWRCPPLPHSRGRLS